MKRLTPALIAALALSLPVSAQETPRSGGTLRYAVSDDPANFDCHSANHFASLMRLAPHYSTLLRFAPHDYPNIDGDLAESWEADPDALTYTFRLRDGVRFHDGTTLDAEDVAASYRRLVFPPEGVISARLESFQQIAAIDVLDPLTVQFTLKEWDVSVLGTFASPWNCIYSAELLESDPQNYPNRIVMGSGPYEFEAFQAGALWTATRFEHYFRDGRPYLDRLESYTMEGPAVVNAIQSGQIHTDFRGVSPQGRDRLANAMGENATVYDGESLTHFLVTFNSQHPPFDDPRVRRALNLAIDRWGGAAGLGRTTEMKFAGGIFMPGGIFAPSDDEIAAYPGFSRDIDAARDEARALLAEAGQENLSFDMIVRNGPPVVVDFGVFLKDQWSQIGVNVNNRVVETPPWATAINNGDFDVIVDIYSALREEPTEQMTKYISHHLSARSAGRFEDGALDDLWRAQAVEADPQARMALLRDFESHLYEESYSLPVFWLERIVVMSADLKGWTFSPSNFLYLDQSETWLAE
ncbi:MAG: ABC transporter substrate-binding protein [Paracoccus sp. (in: a-proteobacteria)]|nr:ABC transporter substrate-binding protein [Paracoccus sp. (in: a-proteobacteria)]